MAEWFRNYALKKTKLLPATTTTTTTTTTTKGLDVTDFPSVAKKVTTKHGSSTPTMSTFQVAILPTKQQRRVLQAMLRVSNVAYNWADYLVTKCNFPPSLYGLQKVVARTSKDEKAATAKRKALDAIPHQYVPDFAENVGMTQHRPLAAKPYVKDYELCVAKKKERRKKCQYLIEHGYTDEIKDKKRKELEALDGKYCVKQRPGHEYSGRYFWNTETLYKTVINVAPSSARSLRHVW
jgi:flagella basal body P-ring formation protein FlgA